MYSNSNRPRRSLHLQSGVTATQLHNICTPEQLFYMLKDYEFGGKLSSVGLRGPIHDEHDPTTTDLKSYHNATEKGHRQHNKHDIWSDEAEFAFLAAELYLPPSSSTKVQFMQKPCGRNEIIALIISFALGKYMTRKQVSSHLQVVRQRKKMNIEVKRLLDQNAYEIRTYDSSSPDRGIPKLKDLHPRIYDIIGISPTENLSDMPKPKWIRLCEERKLAEHRSEEIDASGCPVRSTRRGIVRKRCDEGNSDSDSSIYIQDHHVGNTRIDGGEGPLPQPHQGRRPDIPFARVRKSQSQGDGKSDRTSVTHFDAGGEFSSNTDEDEREIEQVSDSTPRATPDTGNSQKELNNSILPLRSFGLHKVAMSTQFGGAQIMADFQQLPPFASLQSIPAFKLKFPGWSWDRVGSVGSRLYHVVLGLDPEQLLRCPGNNLCIQLDLTAEVTRNIPPHASVKLVTAAGYMSFQRDKQEEDFIDLAFSEGGMTAGLPIVLNTPVPFSDRFLSQLLGQAEDPETSVLPYYWLTQQVVTGETSLTVIFTFIKNSCWSIEGYEIAE